ncbi:hypothetical protein Aperf_G00000024143 [Anoplocephala perfoliata]
MHCYSIFRLCGIENLFLYQVSKLCGGIEHRLNQCKGLLTQRTSETLTLASECKSLAATLTLSGDTICDAVIKVTRNSSGPLFTEYIHEGYGSPFRLQQIQDCWNGICRATAVCEKESLSELRRLVQGAIDSLLFPPLNKAVPGFNNANARACFYPPLSPDSSLHIYLDGGDLIICVSFVFREKFTLSISGNNVSVRQYWASCSVERVKKVLDLLNEILTAIEICSVAMAP